MTDDLDPYYYARDHDAGPGAWCVCGPNGFQFTVPGLDKCVAYVIGKVLSGKYTDAQFMLTTLTALERHLFNQIDRC